MPDEARRAAIRASIEKKKKALTNPTQQDTEGYVSPYLRSLRTKPNKTQADFDELKRVQDERAYRVEVNTPSRPQNQTNPTLAFRNNNPGNLGFENQTGAVRGDGGFARFATQELGYRALERQIRLDRERNLTIEEFAYKYAPPNQNDTERYLANILRQTGLNRNTSLRYARTEDLAPIIARLESSTTVQRGKRGERP